MSTTERWATFDCYGTLIDWNGGIRRALASDELLERYHEVEPQVQAEDPAASYRDVMTETARRIGADDPAELARSLPSWEPFPDVRAALEEARNRGWKLAALSNTDRDFIDASLKRIGVPFELAIVASEIGSYKPARAHWDRFFAQTGAATDHHVHVAQSHFHDVVPARALGLTTIWINRLGERADPAPTRELPDLTRLPDTLDELVPA
ncbi:MAG TPA: HAD-IA family hydrolase [Gaiellaceae bacterium]|nr:HAD-IA family hydrolase [Gaiellaceae bacterium]